MGYCPGRLFRGRKGFSLLEVLLGSLIFSLTFFGIASIWRFHELSLQKYRNRNAARFIIDQEMERFTVLPYIFLEVGDHERTVDLVRAIDDVETTQQFHLTTRITENPEASLKDIMITLTFEERGETKTLVLVTRQARAS